MPPLLFDIDHTLFDTHLFRTLFSQNIIDRFHLDPHLLSPVHQAYLSTLTSSTDFSPTAYLSHLSTTLHLPLSPLKKVFYHPSAFTGSVFPDVFPALNRLAHSYSLGIFSEGLPSYQLQKLHLAGLFPYLSSPLIFIHRRKTTSTTLAQLPPTSIIVDDKISVVSELAASRRFRPLWLNRLDSSSHPYLPTLHSLTDLVSSASILSASPIT